MPDNIKLGDGTLIDTVSGRPAVNTELNRAFDDHKRDRKGTDDFVMGNRRYLDDLPMPAAQSRPVAIIAAYTMFGLTPGDISRTLEVPTDQIRAIKESNDYQTFMEFVLSNVREHDTNAIRKRLNKAATGATDKIVALVDSADEKTALKAAQDILDRTGNRPNDVVEHRHSHEGGITIRVIKPTTVEPPTIDLEMGNAE